MRIEGAWGMASCGREEKGLTLVKDEVLGSSLVGGDRWCIMSLAIRVVTRTDEDKDYGC
jgi:hypothetical protein